MRAEGRMSFGVEEEYLVVDPASREVRPYGAQVAALAARRLGRERVGDEISRFQVEARTSPHTRLADLADDINAMRGAVADAARERGLTVVSSGAPVLGEVRPLPLTRGPRYAESLAAFRALDDEQCAAACHVHVGIADRATALEVSNRLRPWLPVLVSLTANSPYWAGRWTGYASWRTLSWARWPVAGPPPYFDSVAHFDELLGHLHAAGAVMDQGGLYWDVRPSAHVPTLEIRVADAQTTAGETVMYAALVRALALTELRAVHAGEPVVNPAPEVLRAAYWRAARDGLRGHGLDARTRRLEPAPVLAERLYAHVRPALRDNGDDAWFRAAWARLRAHGTGAERQRAAHRGGNRLEDTVDALAGCFRDAG
ncbi:MULTISPECIES: glutamate--cysteine ligase [Streptomyces]|uniref:Putative glutamate--cysteine ligase 2 n=3 Tax=Streptomyces TaxID=1883 RepID=A0A5P2BK72_STRVZ|nr:MULTISPECIES: glutamate--cysteine ligase [Streptomyces]MYZ17744.1 YbdK family carboxylate-amine ligase [Streptomyces sp. SID337]NEB47315.1 YbdK family carboxylate-amine ligase [Streptomyces sp. SID339]QES30885.1 glutamate--cysteine ligase [Streptomyces venezuelae]